MASESLRQTIGPPYPQTVDRLISVIAALLRPLMSNEFICPLDEVLHIRPISVTAVMPAPCQLPIEQPVVCRGHLRVFVAV
jgi:hypothetical protein